MTESSPRGTRYGWYVVGVLTLANISANIDAQILALLAVPIRRDLGLSLTEMSYLIGLPFAIFYTLMGLPIARMADRGNRRNIIAAGIALWSVMTALCGLAGTYSRLLLARIGVGVGEAALAPPATSMLADYFPRERLGSAMSVYSTAIFIGSGLAYFIGGWIIGLVEAQDVWTFPVIGSIRPWQTVFLMVGLPGLLIALLMFTVREPARQNLPRVSVPLGALFRYVGSNARTFVCHSLGFAMSATVNYGIAAWLATFLVEKHGWSVPRAGMVMGILTITVGTLGVLAGGRLVDWFVRNGKIDGALRVGVIGAIGMLVSATAYPFASTATLAIVWLVLVNFFAAFPWGAASAAAAEIVPAAMRAQGVALYFFVLSLVSRALGPIAVATVTDFVFGYDAALPYALAIVNVVGMTGAIALFLFGMPAYRRTLANRDTWA
ncbi:MAG TPA: MFS transporter [Gemmatimonadaceae bacterium]|nr:MFS transporter [Gemmatimonadaceae bacterium]